MHGLPTVKTSQVEPSFLFLDFTYVGRGYFLAASPSISELEEFSFEAVRDKQAAR